MTLEEITRYNQGQGILNEIEDYLEYINRLEKGLQQIAQLDDDLYEEVKNKQIQRYKEKIKQLRKQFVEL